MQNTSTKQGIFQVSHFSVEVCPTFQPSNLTINQNYLVYIQIEDNPKVIVYNLKDVLNEKAAHPKPILLPTTDHPTSIRYLTFYGRQLLVITTVQGFYIYNENATQLLQHHFQSLTDQNLPLEQQEQFFVGSCVGQFSNAQQFIVIGTTNFELFYANKSNENSFVVFKGNQFKSKIKQITCLESIPQKSQLMICDQEGNAHLFQTLDAEEINLIKSISVNFNKMPITCCSILQQQNQSYLCCGDIIGKLTLIELNEFQIYASINAHARIITGLTTFDNMQQIVTISEDTFLNIWNIKSGSVDLDNSIRMSDSLIFGIGSFEKTLIALTYDTNDITLIKF